MRWFKKIVIFMLMFFCVCVPCENYQNYLTIFNDAPKTDFYCPEDVSFDTMLSQIADTSEKYGVLVYHTRTDVKTMFYSEEYIYADETARNYIEEHYDVHEGLFSSLFSGKTSVHFLPFSEVPNENPGNATRFSVVGEKENADKFKSDLIEVYGGELPMSDGFDSRGSIHSMLYTVWIIAIVVACFFTFYETMLMKKENFIRITLGESLPSLWLKFLSLDLLFILISFTVCILFSGIFYDKIFMFDEMLSMFGILIFSDVLISVNLLFYDRNKVLAHLSLSRRLLAINSFVKCFTVVLTVIFVSTSLSVIYEYFQYAKQKSFYELYSDYCVLQNIKVKNGGDDVHTELSEKGGLYLEYAQKADMTLISEGVSLPSGEKVVRVNTQAVDSYVKNVIPELQDYSFDKDLYLIYYEKEPPSEEEKSIIFSGDDSVGEIAYHKQTELVVRTTDDSFTKWVKNPIILYNHKGLEEICADDPLSVEISTPVVFYIIADNGSVEEYMNAHDITFSSTDMMDYFEHEIIKLKRTAYLSLVFTALLIVLEIMILFSILQLEYTVNAIELSIKKIIGYSMFERFKKQYLLSFVLYMVSLIAAVLVSKKLQFGNTSFILYGIIFMCFAETLLFTVLAGKYDRNHIQKILKGGAL